MLLFSAHRKLCIELESTQEYYMSFLKKLSLTLLISAFFLASPSIMAKPAGKIENQTEEELLATFDSAIEAAEATLAAIREGADKETVMPLFKKAKQELNRIESATVNREKERANGWLKKARSAFKKGKTKEAEEKMVKAVANFKKLKQIYLNF